jgi:PEP-CTERM motif
VDGLWASFGLHGGGTCGGPGIGCSTPDTWDIGSPLNVQSDIESGTFNQNPSMANPAAGALVWNVTGLNLGLGQSEQFTVEIVPEPSTLALLLLGGAALWMRRRTA